MARFVWRVFTIAFGLESSKNLNELCARWVKQIGRHLHAQIYVGASALLWSIWLRRNKIIFDKKRLYSYLQVIFRATYQARQWSVLQSVAKIQLIKSACRKLEALAMEIFANHGWPSSKRISFDLFFSI